MVGGSRRNRYKRELLSGAFSGPFSPYNAEALRSKFVYNAERIIGLGKYARQSRGGGEMARFPLRLGSGRSKEIDTALFARGEAGKFDLGREFGGRDERAASQGEMCFLRLRL